MTEGRDDGAGRSRLAGRALASLGLILLASMVAQSFGRFTYPVLLEAIDSDVLGSLTKAGALGTLSLAAYLVGTGLVSWLSTRTEPARIVKVGLVGSALGLGVLALADSFALLALGLAVAGFGGAAVWVPAPGMAATLVGPERGGLAIGVVGSGIGLGIFVVGPLTNGVRSVAGEGAWRPVYAVEFVVAVVVAVAVAAILPSPRGLPGGSGPPRLTAVREVPGWGLLVAAFGLFGASYSLFFYFFVTQLQDAGWAASTTNLVSSLLGLSSIAGGVVFGRVSDRYGRAPAILVGFVMMAVCPLLALTAAVVPVIVAAVGFGLCVAGTPTAIGAHVADHLQGRAFGAAFGSLTFVFGAAQLLGPQLTGLLAERTASFAIPFALASVIAAGGAACGWALGRSGRAHRPVEPISRDSDALL